MPNAQFYPPFDPTAETGGYHYAQAVRIGPRLETAGQGGWDATGSMPTSLEDEITQVFANLTAILTMAGSSWDDVISVDSFHQPIDQTAYDLMVVALQRLMPNHRPIWTAIGVPQFGVPGMRLEVRLTAISSSDPSNK